MYKYLCETLLSILWVYNHKQNCWIGWQFYVNFLSSCLTVFYSGHTILHPHQQCTRVPISPHPPQHFLFSVFLRVGILMSVRWYLIVVFICISLMVNDVQHVSWAYWLFVRIWRNVYSSPLPIFFFNFIYLFIYLWLCWVYVSVRGLSLLAASGGHSSSRCAGPSLSRPLLLWSTGSRRAGSVIVAHGPSCSAACGIFPDQGSNPSPLHWQADSQPLRHQGNPTFAHFLSCLSVVDLWEFLMDFLLFVASLRTLQMTLNRQPSSFSPVPWKMFLVHA